MNLKEKSLTRVSFMDSPLLSLGAKSLGPPILIEIPAAALLTPGPSCCNALCSVTLKI